MTGIKVGDVVTWGHPEPIAKNGDWTTYPLRLAGCKVKEIGYSIEGEPAALIEFCGQEAGARLSELYKE